CQKNLSVATLEAGAVASECGGATNSDALFDTLTDKFCLFGLTNCDTPAELATMITTKFLEHHANALDTNLLMNLILQNLTNTNSCQTIPRTLASLAAAEIVSRCNKASDTTSLYDCLTNEFYGLGLTNCTD